jgi:predicted MFS family arabinose efflux permease
MLPSTWIQVRDALNNKFLLGPKITYFMLNLAYYASQVFVILYAKNVLKMRPDDFGIYPQTVAALAHFLGAPFWSYLSDRFRRHRMLLIVGSVLYAITFQLFILSPYLGLSYTGNIIWICFVNGLQTIFSSAMFPLCDNQIMSFLGRDPKFTKDLFGRQRLWGTIGHGFSSAVMGVICEHLGYDAMFISGGIATILFISVVVLFIPSDDEIKNHEASLPPAYGETAMPDKVQFKAGKSECDLLKKAQRERSGSTSSATSPQVTAIVPTDPESNTPAKKPASFLNLLSNTNFTFFLFVIFITGLSKHILSVFCAEFISSKFSMKEKHVGLATAMHTAPEIVLFFCGKDLLRVMGVHWMLICAQMATVIRVMAFAAVPAEWTWAPYLIETLKGVSTAFLIMSAVRISHDVAPKGMEAIAQGTYNGVFQGLSSACSGLLGGILMKYSSSTTLFWVTGWVSLGAIILLLLKWVCVDRILLSGIFPKL